MCMQPLNAFVGRKQQPSEQEVLAALGPSATLWKDLTAWLADQQGVAKREWKSSSLKYGWSLRFKRKDRTVIHLAPCARCFRAALILGNEAVKAALHSDLPRNVVKAIANAPHYPKGTGVRLTVKRAGDLAAIRKLTLIKLAN